MRSVSLRLSDLERNPMVPIGFEGENEYTTVNIDCKKIFDEHPTAVPTWAVTPPQGDSYPVVVVRDGDIVSWTVSDSDLVYPGSGKFQLSFVIGDEVIGKTYSARTRILDSITPSGNAPTAIQNWLTQAAAALQALPQDVATAVATLMGAMVGVGETLDPGENVTVSYDTENNTLTIGVPRGADGQDGQDGVDGHTPVITAEKVGKVTTLYVDGTAVAEIQDGESGTELIDDNAGAGDTDKVWSADKSASEISDVKSEISQKQDAPETAGTAGQVLGLDNSLNPAWVDKYSKPAGGIPGTDLADSYIKEPSSDGTNGQVLTTDGNGGRSWTTPSGGGGNVTDVQINGTSILSQGVANIPYGTGTTVGVVKVDASYGLQKFNNQGLIAINPVTEAECKGGTVGYKPVCPERQHFAVFYGLSKIAGYDLKSVSVTNGVYPSQSIDKILQMLGVFDLIAQHETTPSTHAYAQGECFIFNGKLCRATTAISVSDAITVGTNCENTTLMAEITR